MGDCWMNAETKPPRIDDEAGLDDLIAEAKRIDLLAEHAGVDEVLRSYELVEAFAAWVARQGDDETQRTKAKWLVGRLNGRIRAAPPRDSMVKYRR